jgi:two-component system, NtrC family, response regulator HydG
MNDQQSVNSTGATNTNKKLVVVDDDMVIQELLVAYFRPKGYDVITFSDAESALLASKNKNSKWDILISDLQLPQMSGLDFIESLKKIRPELPIIFITATNSVETAIKAIENGAYDFILKPIHLAQLKISVERALHISGLNENITELRQHIKTKESKQSDSIIGRSPMLLAALDVAKKVAKSNANIFISGESGSGKEVFARYIHSESHRSGGAFVAINCSAIPENLLESELFGHAKGSFTGASDKKIGLFEAAENGTLFLDEIGDLSPSLQAKLLRVLQEKKIRRVGENELRPINARIISATHKNLASEIVEGRFREDLFFRLNVIPISIPSLRERPEDILPLAESFLKKYTLLNDSPARVFSKEAVKFMLENKWPGNVRELENSVERAVVMCAGSAVQLGDFLLATSEAGATQSLLRAEALHSISDAFVLKVDQTLPDLQEVVQKYIEFAVQRNGGAKDKTAKEIGIDRKTLYRKIKSAEHFVQ